MAGDPNSRFAAVLHLNNYGVFGVDGSAIIKHPEVAILGVGRIIDRPWVLGAELAVRMVTQLTLTFDLRVCNGGTAGGFLRLLLMPLRTRAQAGRHVILRRGLAAFQALNDI